MTAEELLDQLIRDNARDIVYVSGLDDMGRLATLEQAWTLVYAVSQSEARAAVLGLATRYGRQGSGNV